MMFAIFRGFHGDNTLGENRIPEPSPVSEPTTIKQHPYRCCIYPPLPTQISGVYSNCVRFEQFKTQVSPRNCSQLFSMLWTPSLPILPSVEPGHLGWNVEHLMMMSNAGKALKGFYYIYIDNTEYITCCKIVKS